MEKLSNSDSYFVTSLLNKEHKDINIKKMYQQQIKT
eukprot:UN10774